MMGAVAERLYSGMLGLGWRVTLLVKGGDGKFEGAMDGDDVLRELPNATQYRVAVRRVNEDKDRVNIDIIAEKGKETRCRLFGYYEVVRSRGTYSVMERLGYVGDSVAPDNPSLLDACAVMMCVDVHRWDVAARSLHFNLRVSASYVVAGDGDVQLFTCFLRPEGGKVFAVVEQSFTKDGVRTYASREDFIAWAGRVAGATTADGVVSVSKWKGSVLLLVERVVGVLAAPPTACDRV